MGRATEADAETAALCYISIHALRGEGDFWEAERILKPNDFYPRPPWGGRLDNALRGIRNLDISIHALRGEGDFAALRTLTALSGFLSTPSVGRATDCPYHRYRASQFLSTPSVGRATCHMHAPTTGAPYFYPRPPWGGRQNLLVGRVRVYLISIHALRGEGDDDMLLHFLYPLLFLSTPSVGRATRIDTVSANAAPDFYPRPPWGGRLIKPNAELLKAVFLSMPSVGRATTLPSRLTSQMRFLSTPSVGRATTRSRVSPVIPSPFLSTPSVGRATPESRLRKAYHAQFLSTPSVGRATAAGLLHLQKRPISIHALRGEGDRYRHRAGRDDAEFLSTPSVGRATCGAF